MEHDANRPIDAGLGTEALNALLTIPATDISVDPSADRTPLPSQSVHRAPPAAPAPNAPADAGAALGDQRDYRFYRAVANHPLRPSSDYPGLAGISPKLAIPIRQKLLALGLLRQEAQDIAGRGRTSLLLTVTDKGRAALKAYRALHPEER